MLEISRLTAGYGKVDVLRDVSLAVPERSFVGLLGPNGAGKTTLMRSISGLTQIRGGHIALLGQVMRGRSPEDIVDAGVIHVPQGRMLFPDMTVEENLELGAYRKAARGGFAGNLERVHAYFPILKERKRQRAGVLSGGEQQMLAIGRALMAEPRLLILDEPSIGLAPRIIDEIFDSLRRINADGVTIVVAEQNAMKVLRTTSYACILENGRIALQGPSTELLHSERVRSSYLGVA